jgi:hypothetical protein
MRAIAAQHRPSPWPDHDADFRTHDDAASWWLLVFTLPLWVAALVVSVLAVL